MNWLALLKELEGVGTDTLQNPQKASSVGFVGTRVQENCEESCPVNQRSSAVVMRIRRLGDQVTAVEAVVDTLAVRDQRRDDRHMCLECTHLHGVGNRRYCRQGRHADALFGPDVPKEMLATLHRCRRFKHCEHQML